MDLQQHNPQWQSHLAGLQQELWLQLSLTSLSASEIVEIVNGLQSQAAELLSKESVAP